MPRLPGFSYLTNNSLPSFELRFEFNPDSAKRAAAMAANGE